MDREVPESLPRRQTDPLWIQHHFLATGHGESTPNATATYTGGYVNSGFSGGAIVYSTTGKQKHRWSIAGIITKRGGVPKRTGIDEDGKRVVIMEPTGMVKFTRMERVLELIDEATDAIPSGVAGASGGNTNP